MILGFSIVTSLSSLWCFWKWLRNSTDRPYPSLFWKDKYWSLPKGVKAEEILCEAFWVLNSCIPQNCYPVRLKAIYAINTPPLAETLLALIKPFLNYKLLNRVRSNLLPILCSYLATGSDVVRLPYNPVIVASGFVIAGIFSRYVYTRYRVAKEIRYEEL